MNCRTWFTVLVECFCCVLNSSDLHFLIKTEVLFSLIANNNKRSIILEIKTTGVKLLKY